MPQRSTPLKRTAFKRKPKTAEQRADELFSRLVRARDGDRCRRCGSAWNVTCAHVIRRDRHSVRWVMQNGITLCWSPCHSYMNEHEHEWRAWCVANGVPWDLLHWRSLHDAPERAEDALVRLRRAA